jgi:hypothetical protein
MTGPNYRRGYLRLPLDVWSELYCQAPLTRRQLQLVSVVIRDSWGWSTPSGGVYCWTRRLKPRQFADRTGLAIDHLGRDLRRLVARGVLLEQDERYQLVPDPALWKSPEATARELRQPAPKPPAAAAVSATTTSALKKAQIRQRNVGSLSRNDFSTDGDNCRLFPESPESKPKKRQEPTASEQRPTPVARAVAVIAALIGPLSEEETQALRRWVKRDGIATVWTDLAHYAARGSVAARKRLKRQLAPFRPPT